MISRLINGILCLIVAATTFSGCSFLGSSEENEGTRQPFYYQVKSGDSLYKISQQHHVTQGQLIRLNSLKNPNSLEVGQRLLIGYRTGRVLKGSIPNNSKNGNQYFYTDGILAWPVSSGGRIVSTFGPRDGSFHDGLDIADATGTPILSAHNGKVVYSGDDLSGYGNLLIVRGDTGIVTVYAHNSKLLASVGDRVKRGEKIALLGSSGRASGPHLHFEVRTRDRRKRYVAVDPLPLFKKESGVHPRYRINENLSGILARAGLSR